LYDSAQFIRSQDHQFSNVRVRYLLLAEFAKLTISDIGLL